MTFPSRGCRTCKTRRVKCDEAHPICNRCAKAKVACRRAEDQQDWIFLNENQYAVGQTKRPRGPNLMTTSSSSKPPSGESRSKANTPVLDNAIKSPKDNVNGSTELSRVRIEPQMGDPNSFLPPSLTFPMQELALNYYFRYHIEAPNTKPNRYPWESQYVTSIAISTVLSKKPGLSFQAQCEATPESALSLTFLAISHATFGRSSKATSSLSAGSAKYSAALAKLNACLKDPAQATHDEILLATIILSHYENSVMGRGSDMSKGITSMASRTFAHHDGAMALLNLRRGMRGQDPGASSIELDRLVRRHLVRSCLTRGKALPGWLHDGALYGEEGFALGLDRCMVAAAELRSQISDICTKETFLSLSAIRRCAEMIRLHKLLSKAQSLDDMFRMWARDLPMEDYWKAFKVEDGGANSDESTDKIFNKTVYIFPSEGHAGMWCRYKVVRLHINAIIVRILTLARLLEPDATPMEEAARSKIEKFAMDFCASVPYIMKAIAIRSTDENAAGFVITRAPAIQREDIKVSTVALLAWPLIMAIMVPEIPARHLRYLKKRLLEVSEIVDDGMLESAANAMCE